MSRKITTILTLAFCLTFTTSQAQELKTKKIVRIPNRVQTSVSENDDSRRVHEIQTYEFILARSVKSIIINQENHEYKITPNSGDIKIIIKNYPEDPCAIDYWLKTIIDGRFAMFRGKGECDNESGVFIDLHSGYYADHVYASDKFSPNKKRIVTISKGEKIEIYEPNSENKFFPESVTSINFSSASRNPDDIIFAEFSSWKSDDELVLKVAPLDLEYTQSNVLLKSKMVYKTFAFNPNSKKWEEKKSLR